MQQIFTTSLQCAKPLFWDQDVVGSTQNSSNTHPQGAGILIVRSKEVKNYNPLYLRYWQAVGRTWKLEGLGSSGWEVCISNGLVRKNSWRRWHRPASSEGNTNLTCKSFDSKQDVLSTAFLQISDQFQWLPLFSLSCLSAFSTFFFF